LGDKINIIEIFTVEQLEDMVRKVPNDFESNLLLAEKCMQRKDFSRAMGPLTTLSTLMRATLQEAEAKKRPEISVRTLLLPKRYSLEDYRKMFRLQLESLAICHMELRQFNEALKYMKQTLELNDSDPESWNVYGVLLDKMGRIDSAERAYLSALTHNPLYEDSWRNLELVYRALSRTDEAARVGKFLQSSRNLVDAASLISFLLSLQGNTEQVVKFVERHLRKHILNPEILSILCGIFIHQERYRDAERILDRLISKNPDNISNRWQLARLYALQNKTDQCLNTLGTFKEGDSPYSQSLLLRDAPKKGEGSIQSVKVFFQYFRKTDDSSSAPSSGGLYLRYLTELHVKVGTSVGDLVHSLVNGELKRISSYAPHLGLPSVHCVTTFGTGGGRVYCDSLPCMLNEIRGDSPASFIITYHETKVPRDGGNADLSDLLFTGDVLLLRKEPSTKASISVTMTSALILEPTLKMMIDEEMKGQTKLFFPTQEEPTDKSDLRSEEKKSIIAQDRFIDELLKEMDKQNL